MTANRSFLILSIHGSTYLLQRSELHPGRNWKHTILTTEHFIAHLDIEPSTAMNFCIIVIPKSVKLTATGRRGRTNFRVKVVT